MSTVNFLDESKIPEESLKIIQDIKAERRVKKVNNFWKALSLSPKLLKNIWEQVRIIMKPGAIDEVTKELIYIAVSSTNGCEYCVYSHTFAARKKGMTQEQYNELLEVIALANTTNALASSLQVPVDEEFKSK
tara:strand:+ start:129 stop:527 length:399 start_codon:yes stop_codon:yes gene_type:complete